MSLTTHFHVKTPDEIIQEGFDRYGIESLYVLKSGGKDSTCAEELVATNYPQYKGTIYTCTGTHLKESRWFVRDQAYEKDRNLIFTWPVTSYWDWVLKHGFGGEGVHSVVMANTKSHTWRAFIQEHLAEHPALISGVRRKESKRRGKRIAYKQPIDKDWNSIYIKPLFYKTGLWIWDYIEKHNLKVSPVNDIMGYSGDSVCGCFAEKYELKMIEKYYPYMFSAIKYTEKQIQIRGTNEAKKYPTWGSGSTIKDVEMQTTLQDWINELEEETGINKSTINFEEYCGESCSVQA